MQKWVIVKEPKYEIQLQYVDFDCLKNKSSGP